MSRTVADVMTTEVVTLPATARVREAAQAMRDHDIGDVVVLGDAAISGILTDRDIVVRAVASEMDAQKALIGTIHSANLETVQPDTSVDDAVALMRDRAVRRLPVVDADGRPVGVVSIGDLARMEDPQSALADISKAPPNE
ncbi:CBS domain-containing protein [Jiangella asiatica]|uniref:CBS domain-containing protein n=1 Tax=Jiangella asiatica TaxID=2530372 RepID=A0A4R5DJ76_9ACTN|nr:CBS domain-containing protein [Jiangella asiatica]TDE14182.1 CBS domain-containing protein [Jiangella asiatica]